MVPQRVFQTIRRIRILPIVVVASAAAVCLAFSGFAAAQSDGKSDERKIDPAPIDFRLADTVLIDLRPGEDTVRAPSREAFLEALGEHGELRLSGGLELRRALARSPHSAVLEQGRAALAGVAMAYSALDCPGTFARSDRAILDLAAAGASGIDTSTELRTAYLYRFLCAHRASDVDSAMAAASMLRTLAIGIGEDGRPKEISSATWQTYPQVDAQSSQLRVPVEVESVPEAATIWVDFEERGQAPMRVFLSAGEHIVALGSPKGAVSQRVTVTGPGTIKLPIQPRSQQWQGMAQSVEALRLAVGDQRDTAMRDLMAAVEAQVAFVMREPGRIAVWVLPLGKTAAQHVGHAPNASIAGSLALQALAESARAPGLDPNMPLLREDDVTKVGSTSNRRWWVYGVVLGAAAVGAGLIIAQDLSEDRQRIEVSLP
jgi:hypothetical protein